MSRCCCLLALLPVITAALRFPARGPMRSSFSARTSALAMVTGPAHSRREVLSWAAVLGGTAPALATWPAGAADARPILVLGASGGTGLECVNYLVSQGLPVIAATRSGDFAGATSKLVTVAKGDVTSKESLAELIQPGSLRAVIYAASASRQKDAKATSNAKAVDRDGVVACAELCITSEVPRLVLVSSGGVSKPKSAVFQVLNTFANGAGHSFECSGTSRVRPMRRRATERPSC